MVAKFHPSDLSSTFKCPVSGSVNLAVTAVLATQAWWRQGHTSGAQTCCKPSKLLATSSLARNAPQHLPSEILGDFHLVTLSD